jgi:hypothetical protein
MIKTYALLIALAVISLPALAQENTPVEKRKGRPDIPGTFTLEFGLNQPSGAPSRFDQAFWGSRTLNIYYQYDLRILKSRFFLIPGVGFSLERFKFRNDHVLSYNGADLAMQSPSELSLSVRKSMLVTNYFEIPVELAYRTKPDDPARSFKIAFGGRVGYLFDSFTKVKYKEGSETKKYKDKQDFQLNKLRYGVYGKLGVGNISLFGYYNLSPLFETDKGPIQDGVTSEINTVTIGISLASF